MRDLAARVVEVHPVAPPLLRRLLLVRRAGSSRTSESAATKALWWQANLQLLHTSGDAFAVRRWGCSSWQACASTRVVLTGGAHGLAGCTLRASKKAARAVAHGTTVVPSGSCSGELCLCISDCARASVKGVPRVRKTNGSAHRRCRSQAWSSAHDWRLGWRCPSRRRPSSRVPSPKKRSVPMKRRRAPCAWFEGGNQQKGGESTRRSGDQGKPERSTRRCRGTEESAEDLVGPPGWM